MSVLRTAYVNVLPKTDKFAPQLNRQLRSINAAKAGEAAAGSFSKGFGGKLKSSLAAVTGGLGGPLTGVLGLGAAAAAIGKIGMEYEDNLNIFQSVTKATGDQMDQVAKKARQLGADVTLPGVSAAGAAASMTELSKAGFSVQQAMDGATGTLRLARAAGLDEAQAATIAANAVNAFGIKAQDVTFVADELAAAANSSSVEVTDVADSFKMAAAVFSSFQKPAVGSKEAITELNTAIAILGNNGIKGSDAGTSLKQMLLQLTGPSAQAKDLMKELAFNAAGATVSMKQQNEVLHGSNTVRDKAIAEIAKHNKGLKDTGDIAFDATGKMRSLPQIIDLVTKGTKNMSDEEKDFAITQIFGADASRAVIALMKGGLPVYEQQRKAVMEAGAAAAVAAAKNKGLRGAIDNVQSQLENAAIAIYNAVKGPLTSGLNGVANALAPMAGGIARFAGSVASNIGTIRDWGVAIGAVTLALKLNSVMLAVNAAGGLVSWVKTLGPIVSGTRAWAGAQALLNVALFANPIGIVIVALTALVAGVILAYRHSETFRKIVDAAWRGIAAAASWAWNNVIFPIVKLYVWYFKNVLAPVALWLWHNVIQPAWAGIQWAIHAAWVVIQVIFAAWKLYITKVVAPVVLWLWNKIVKPTFTAIGAVIRSVWNNVIKPVFTTLASFISKNVAPGFSKGVDAIRTAWERVQDAARKPVNFVINSVVNPLIRGFNTIAGKLGVKDRIPEIPPLGGGGRGLPTNRAEGGRGHSRGDGPGIGDGFGDVLGFFKGPARWLSSKAGLGRIKDKFGSNFLTRLLTGAGGKAVGWLKDKALSLFSASEYAGGGTGAGGLQPGILGILASLRNTFGNVPLISGFRAGARTLTGNRSYHALGRAIDIAPVYAWAAYLSGAYGGQLRELITPWQQFNRLNGRPHTYTGAVWNQHNFAGGNAHIHAALDDGGMRVLRPGWNAIPNWTGRNEPIYGPVAARGGGDVHIHIHDSVITSKEHAKDLVVAGYKAAVRAREIPAPPGWKR